jgi:PAS domain S-box-containing protein
VRYFAYLSDEDQVSLGFIDNFHSEEYPFHHRALKGGQAVLLDTATSNSYMTSQEYALVFQNNLDVALFLPLIFQNRQLGIAVLTQKGAAETFPETKIHLGEAVVREAVVALSNAWTYHSLVEAHRRIQLLIDNVAEGVFSIDVKRRITDFNPAAEQLTGYSASHAKTLSVSQLLVCDEQHCLLCRRDLSLQDAVRSGAVESPSHCRAWIIQQNGRRRAVSHSVAPLMSSEQQVTGAVSVVRDISKEEELVRMKSEFISLVSHQLRTPLTNISIAAEILVNSDDRREGDVSILNSLKQQSVRLRRLVDQVLMASRLERGLYQKTAVEPLALRPLLEETVRIFRTQHPELDFPLSVPGDVPFVWGDRVLVEVVLENLIQNAIDHAQGVSEIAITVESQDTQILVSVADNGAGIPEEEREQIFSPFHSGSDAGKRRRGFGLGLYLTRMAVEAQGGEIWMTPNHGHGTCFYFTLNTLQGD